MAKQAFCETEPEDGGLKSIQFTSAKNSDELLYSIISFLK